MTFPWAESVQWTGDGWLLTCSELKAVYSRIRRSDGLPFSEVFEGLGWPKEKRDRALELLRHRRMVRFDDGWRCT